MHCSGQGVGGGAGRGMLPAHRAAGEQLLPFAFRLCAGPGTASEPGIVPLPAHLLAGARRAAGGGGRSGAGGSGLFVSVEQAAAGGYALRDTPLPVFEAGGGLYTYEAPLCSAPLMSAVAFSKAMGGRGGGAGGGTGRASARPKRG
jgi:hypothetical protein